MLLAMWSDFGAAVDWLALGLLDTAMRSVLIVGLAGVGTMALRRASAAARHWVWVLGFAGLLLLPVCAGVIPGWRVLPRVVGERADERAMVDVMAAPVFEEPVVELPGEESGDGGVAAAEMDAVVGTAEGDVGSDVAAPAVAVAKAEEGVGNLTVGGPAPRPGPNVGSATPAGMAARSWGIKAVRWTGWMVLVWLGGVAVVLGHLAVGHVSLWRLRRGCVRLEGGEWAAMIEGLCREFCVGRRVELLSSPLRTMPMTWGLWRAHMLVPAAAAEWPAEQRRAVLLHELAHVRRWDCLTQLLAQAACAGYWFNPAVWVAWRRMQVERERACDDAVLNTGARASAYARHLVESASPMESPRFVGAAALAMARRSTLEERVGAILDGRRDRRAMTRWGAWVMVLLLAMILVPVAILRAQGAAGRGAAGAPGAATLPATGEEVKTEAVATGRGEQTCLLDATIYDVRMPVEKIGQLDMEALARAAGAAADFEKALAGVGTARPLYHVNQSARLSGDSITTGASVPYITNSQMTGTGQAFNSVSYTQVGATINVAGKTGGLGSGRAELDLHIGLSTKTDGVAISDEVMAPTLHTISLAHKGPVEVRRPFVVMSANGITVDKEGKAIVYIARVNLDLPPLGGGAARGE